MFDPIPAPGLLTDLVVPAEGWDRTQYEAHMQWVRAHKYDWISYQAYNPHDGGMKNRDLGPARAAGLSPGVWGVTYDKTKFHADGVAMGTMASHLGAEHLIVDAEECAKFTKADRGMLPLIVGVREGGWTGPVHLCPMGAPDNPVPHGGNDYQVDVESFLMTGGGVLPQCYVNAYGGYRPSICVDYWKYVGVPANRINVMIDLAAEGGRPRMSGSEWAPFLHEAGVYRNFSIYMDEFLQPFDLEGLDEFSTLPPKGPPVINDAEARKKQIADLTQEWLDNFGPSPLSRLAAEHDIAVSSDDLWYKVRGSVRAALTGRNLLQEIADLQAKIDKAKLALS